MSLQLMQIFDFTQEDLEFNRRGALSPRQGARLGRRRRQTKSLLLGLGILLACVGGGILAGLGIQSLAAEREAGTGMLIGAGVFVLLGAPLIFLGVKPPTPVKIAVATGLARLARVQRSQRTNNVTSTYVVTELHIADQVFTVPDQAFSALEDGASYTAYYWDGVGDIFSIEQQ